MYGNFMNFTTYRPIFLYYFAHDCKKLKFAATIFIFYNFQIQKRIVSTKSISENSAFTWFWKRCFPLHCVITQSSGASADLKASERLLQQPQSSLRKVLKETEPVLFNTIADSSGLYAMTSFITYCKKKFYFRQSTYAHFVTSVGDQKLVTK